MKHVFLLSITVCFFILVVGCNPKSSEVAVVSRLVKVVVTDNEDAGITNEFNGVVEESRKADVAFRVGGPITGIFADEGDYVKAGDLLAVIDPRDYQVSLRSAEAQYSQTKAEFERYQELFNQNKLPANTFEKVETAWLAAKSKWDNARNAYADTRLEAPFSGHIFKKYINKYENINPGNTAFTLLCLDELEVVFGVPETLVENIAGQTTAKVFVAVVDIQTSVKSVAGKSGSNNLYEVRLSMKNPDVLKIRPGMSAKVLVNVDKNFTGKHLVVPVEAVFYQQQVPHIWIYNKETGTVTARKVDTGNLKTSGKIEIINGLIRNEMVVAAGVHSLYENQPVRVMTLNNSL